MFITKTILNLITQPIIIGGKRNSQTKSELLSDLTMNPNNVVFKPTDGDLNCVVVFGTDLLGRITKYAIASPSSTKEHIVMLTVRKCNGLNINEIVDKVMSDFELCPTSDKELKAFKGYQLYNL